MARTAAFTGYTYANINQAAHTQAMILGASWGNGNDGDYQVRYGHRVGYNNPPTDDWNSDGLRVFTYNTITGLSPAAWADVSSSGSTLTNGTTTSGIRNESYLLCDKTYYVQTVVVFYDFDDVQHTAYSSAYSFKTNAVDPTVGTPSLSGATAHTVAVNGSWTPATADTTVKVWVQYKKASNPTWSTWNVESGSGTGYTSRAITATTITGLDPSTSYNFRLLVQRTNTTNTTKDYYGSVASVSTIADTPDVTTNAASVVSHDTATLNGTVDPNNFLCGALFQWGTSSGVYPNETSYDVLDGDTAQAVSRQIIGLSPLTTYYFRAKVVVASDLSEVYGAEQSFTTLDNPEQYASEEDMLPIQTFYRKYGVATTIRFVVPVPAVTSSNSFYTGAAVWAAAGESKISKDGGAFADTTNDPAQIEAQQFELDLTATEMEHNEAMIILSDAGGAVRDVMLKIVTQLELGNIILDTLTGAKDDVSAFSATGHGTGHGIEAIGGATGRDISGFLGYHSLVGGLAQGGGASTVTLPPTASATNDIYNTCIVMIVAGIGVGQSRVITGYAGATQIATVDAAWTVAPTNASVVVVVGGARTWQQSRVELSSMPADTANMLDKVQFIFQRFAFKITQTATLQTMFKADNSTSLTSRSVGDAAGTQTIAKCS